MEENRNGGRYLLMLVTSMLIYGTIGVFRRFIPLSSGFLVFSRGILGGAFLLIYLSLRKRGRADAKTSMGAGKVFWFVLAGMFIGINWMLLFEAYNYTTVAAATLCYYMAPVIVILLSPVLLRERLTLKKGICALVAIMGMILVSGILSVSPEETGQAGQLKGIALALGAAVLYATVVIMNKKVGKADVYWRTIIQLLSAALVMIPYLLITGGFRTGPVSPTAMALVLVLGIIHTGIAYALYFGSIEGLKGQTVAIFSYIDPVSAMILSAVILHESLSIAGAAGAVMILGAAILSEV